MKPSYEPSYKLLRRLNWSLKFEELMRSRLIMGRFRYGTLGAVNRPIYNRSKSIEKRLKLYDKTGNMELLVDIANLALCEFVEGNHPYKHFKTLHESGVGMPKEG